MNMGGADLTIDIEMIPAQEPRIIDWLRERAPLEIKGDETEEDAFNRLWEATSLDPTYGEILSIGAAMDNRGVKVWMRKLGEPEADMLDSFFRGFCKVPNPRVIGHNIMGYDIPALRRRGFVRGIRLPTFFTKDLKPWSPDVFDTMMRWSAEWRQRPKLGALSFALGLSDRPNKGAIDGADIWRLVKEGQYETIERYQRSDVDDARACAWRMLGREAVFTERGEQ